MISRTLIRRKNLEKLETAFELTSTAIRYGDGVTRELGWDAAHLGATSVLLVTEKKLADSHPGFDIAFNSLKSQGLKVTVFDDVVVEPTKASMEAAADYSAGHPDVDLFVSFGGGSVMDTAKVMNLHRKYPVDDFDSYVNAPIGQGSPVPGPLYHHIALPTTSGTGSETTGVSIFDVPEIQAKTGIAHKYLKPTLALVDPTNTHTLCRWTSLFPGLDVFCHAAESFTARPYNRRPGASSPAMRPAYQGSGPISDVFALEAFKLMATNLPLINEDLGNADARAGLALASTMAGNAFGNAGVHLCHGISYPVASAAPRIPHGKLPRFYDNVDKPLIPHGLSVALPAPAVFEATGRSNPEKHLILASILSGRDVNVTRDGDEAGAIFADAIRMFFDTLGVPQGLESVGFSSDDVDALTQGTLPQKRVLDCSPINPTENVLREIIEKSL